MRKPYFRRLWARLLTRLQSFRVRSLIDQLDAARQTIQAERIERERLTNALADLHDIHRELQLKYTALRFERFQDWSLADRARTSQESAR